MSVREKSKRLLIIGIIGCLLYVIGDFLFAATGKGQTTESIGFMVRIAYLEMGTWRMVAASSADLSEHSCTTWAFTVCTGCLRSTLQKEKTRSG